MLYYYHTLWWPIISHCEYFTFNFIKNLYFISIQRVCLSIYLFSYSLPRCWMKINSENYFQLIQRLLFRIFFKLYINFLRRSVVVLTSKDRRPYFNILCIFSYLPLLCLLLNTLRWLSVHTGNTRQIMI